MSLNKEYLLSLGKIHPELEQILATSQPAPALGNGEDLVALRGRLRHMKQKLNEANSPQGEVWFTEHDITIPVRDGTTIAARVHAPKDIPEDGCPLFVVFHGGGFVLGDLENEVTLCRQWNKLGGVALNVDYRLAPEHKFPIPGDDTYDALKWAAAHLKELNANPKKAFIVGGISAGANLSAVAAHLYSDEQLEPKLTGAWLSIPLIMGRDNVPDKYKEYYLAMEQNISAPILNKDSMAFFERSYQPDSSSPLRAPILFPSHANLPPTYFQICGMDPLRDDAFIYEHILRTEYGIKTKIHAYPGLPHSFWSGYPEASFSKDFQKDCVEAMEWLLQSSKT